MRIGRTLPPTAAPVRPADLWHGLVASFGKDLRRRIEAELKSYFGVRHVFLMSSGKAALTLTLHALKALSGRTRVLIPAYTCFSVPSAVVKAGLEVVLCDIDPLTLDFDYGRFDELVDERTLCVVGTHLFGVPANLDRIRGRCRETGAFVVEDAAQAMGVSWRGRKLGSLGDAGLLSFGRGKNITCGTGGVILTDVSEIAHSISRQYETVAEPAWTTVSKQFLSVLLMSLFIRPRLYWFPSALPFLRLGETRFDTSFEVRRLSRVSAGLLHDWRRRLDDGNRVRAAATEEHCRRLVTRSPGRHPYLRLPVLLESAAERDALCARGRALGLGIGLMYPSPISEIQQISHLFSRRSYPGARRVAATLVTLPTHHLLSARDCDRISSLFLEAGVSASGLDVARPLPAPQREMAH